MIRTLRHCDQSIGQEPGRIIGRLIPPMTVTVAGKIRPELSAKFFGPEFFQILKRGYFPYIQGFVAAAALQVSRPALSSLLNSKADLSGEMALRIEKAFGVKMETLMRMQSAFDIAKTRSREKEIRVRRFHPRATEVHL